MNQEPLVAIEMPTYSRPEGFRNQHDATCSQGYKNIEIHRSKDSSTNPFANKANTPLLFHFISFVGKASVHFNYKKNAS